MFCHGHDNTRIIYYSETVISYKQCGKIRQRETHETVQYSSEPPIYFKEISPRSTDKCFFCTRDYGILIFLIGET